MTTPRWQALPKLLVMAALCACGGSRAIDAPAGGAAPEPAAGPPQGAGSVPDAGSGQGVDPAPAPVPTIITAVPCPETPPLLWSRTFSDEVDFRGAADDGGYLYWTEYDPPPSSTNPDPPGWLVSADTEGQVRYRVPAPAASWKGAFLIADGKAVMSKGALFAAHDVGTGTLSWSLDLTASYSDVYVRLGGIADAGNGELAFALTDSLTSGLYLVEIATGRIVWSSVSSAAADYSVLGADGAGSVLATAWPSSTLTPQYETEADVFVIDGAGRQAWKVRIANGPPRGGSLLAWPAGAPWLGIQGIQGISSRGPYLATPATWFTATMGTDLGFALAFGSTATTPDNVQAVRGDAVVATAALPGTTSYDGVAAWPFLADDHLVLVAQSWSGSPGLCHPATAGAATLSRIDTTTSYQCPLAFQGESGIEGAALLPGRLIISRRTYLTDGCTQVLQPVTIEAYGLSCESLAPAGWVQRGGSPGLGMRPITP